MGLKEERFCKPRSNASGAATVTRFLYVAGVGAAIGSDVEKLRTFFGQFGELDYTMGDAIDMVAERRYCYVCFKEASSAEKALSFITKDPTCDAAYLLEHIGASKLIPNYALEKASLPAPASTEIECTSSARNQALEVPGCYIIPDFITTEEEAALLAELAGEDAPWRENLSRRVQHYGFAFNYRTLMLDYNKPATPMPESCNSLIERFYSAFSGVTSAEGSGGEGGNDTGGSGSNIGTCGTSDCTTTNTTTTTNTILPINQLTINEYTPGQGINSHTDTEACLGPEIFILNLESDIVMTLTRNEPEGTKDSTHTPVRKLLHLPARSLLILSRDARYLWSHAIPPRRSDKINGSVVTRGRRVSLTFRQALKPGAQPASELKPGELELDHVVRVYDNIAIHWNHTRGKRKVYWHRVKEYLDALPVGTLLADVGSGDGKYFGVNPGVVTIGCDRSLKLLEVSRCAEHDTFCCDGAKVPLTSDTFDATLCIAVLHHLSTVDRRYAVLSELIRITKPYGTVMIQAWALEQDQQSKRIFESQDTMVPWRLSKRFLSEAQQAALLSGGGGVGGVGGSGVGGSGVGGSGGGGGGDDTADTTNTTTSNTTAEPTTATATTTTTATAAVDSTADSGPCQHVTEDSGELVFQRYCHVYKEGELEQLCSSIPNCVVVESGWDKGNWFVQLQKVPDARCEQLPSGPESKIPVLAPRKMV